MFRVLEPSSLPPGPLLPEPLRTLARLGRIFSGHILRPALAPVLPPRPDHGSGEPTALPAPYGVRRKPRPQERIGLVRGDTGYTGDRNGTRGVFVINMVDEATQTTASSVNKLHVGQFTQSRPRRSNHYAGRVQERQRRPQVALTAPAFPNGWPPGSTPFARGTLSLAQPPPRLSLRRRGRRAQRAQLPIRRQGLILIVWLAG